VPDRADLPPTVSEARLASVLDTAVFGIIVIDERGRVLMYNKACERMFGWSAAEVIGNNVKMIMPPGYAREHDTYIRNYLSTGVPKIIGIGREVHAQHKDGTIIPIQLAVGEAETPDGRQFIGILRDLRFEIAAMERADALQAQLVRMARINAMDEMGAALAHELNQPLTAVMLYLQAVARAVAKRTGADALPPEIADILGKALVEADRAGKIIHRMRRFVEKREAIRQVVDLGRLIDESIDFTVIGSRAREIRINRVIPSEALYAEVDPVQIQQIMVNLIRNAIDAMKDSEVKELTVRLEPRGAMHTVSVLDSGPGIRHEVLPDLFKAFASSGKQGMGLGLAISKTIAQSHGGDLTVDPGGGGRGACFTLHLPKADAAAAASAARDED
jgi:two-component system sensor kinase FixL